MRRETLDHLKAKIVEIGFDIREENNTFIKGDNKQLQVQSDTTGAQEILRALQNGIFRTLRINFEEMIIKRLIQFRKNIIQALAGYGFNPIQLRTLEPGFRQMFWPACAEFIKVCADVFGILLE